MAADVDADFDLRLFLFQEHVRRVGHFQRQVFQVDALQIERRRLFACLLGVLILFSHENFRVRGGQKIKGGRREAVSR